MSIIDHPVPAFGEETVHALLRERFGLGGTLSPLASERDQNFRVDAADGRTFVFKIVNAAEPETAIAFQTGLLAHAARFAPEIPAPRIVPPLEGGDRVTVEDAAGVPHAIRLVTWLEGTPLARAEATPEVLRDLGRTLGRLDRALLSFGHAGAHHSFDWDLRRTPRARPRLAAIANPERRALVAGILDAHDARVAPALPALRCGVIHNDANDWNILVEGGRVSGLIDFGDALHAPLVCELAIACAYAMLDKASPLEAAGAVAAGYHAALPLEDAELALLPDLIADRLAISVSIAATRQEKAADNPYLLISEKPAWDLIARLARIEREIAVGILRKACGLDAAPGAGRLRSWLAANRRTLAPLLSPHPATQARHVLDLADPDTPLVAATAAQDDAAAAAAYAALERAHGFTLGLGAWGEIRSIYSAPAFRSVLVEGQRRTMHLGLDLFAPAGTPVLTPVAGRVVAATINPTRQDYGGLVLLEHEPEPGLRFRSLWGHLGHASVRARTVGEMLPAGAEVARLGDFAENGGWVPHLHLQLVTGDGMRAQDLPGVGEPGFAEVWADLYPRPDDFAGLAPETFAPQGRDKAALLTRRRERLGDNLSISYRTPLKIVRGEDVWLYDETGRAYLDCYNNVAHVGHCHPSVVAAIARQAARLNTNTRYLHDTIIDYADRLAATLPPELDHFYFVCSGSEANELALRMARTATGRPDMLVLDWAYHGTTQGLIDVSPYKYKRRGGSGRPEHTHELPVPEVYRAPDDWPADEIGRRHAIRAAEIVRDLVAAGRPPAAFLAETIPSVAGQVFLPPDYLALVYAVIRAAGGLCIADEVQVGFGRVGGAMWAFQEHGVVPDIVTMGKPAGNGHPLAVVAVRGEIARRFANGMEYFNTFGGNPVSCAAGLAVLDVLAEERLLANAGVQGDRLLDDFRGLAERYPAIGDVRGRGLFIGIELVRDRTSKAHDGAAASAIVNRARELGVLAGTDGPYDNVIKLRPPMTFRREHAEMLVETLDRAMADVLG